MVLAVVLVLLVVASVAFYYVSPWYLTPLASNWSAIDTTLDITFVVTGAVFVAINLFMAYCVFRYRHKATRRSAYEPENKKLEWWLMGLTTVGVAAMLAPGLWVWAEFVNVPKNATEFEAVGQQWQWSFRLPGEDGKLGAVDSRYVSDENPFGMEEDDPRGQDDVLLFGPEIHVLIDQPVKALLRSKDVLHDFAVAQFRVKMDLVPGLVSHLWFTPTRTGEFEILCQELCGVGHFAMRGMVVVDNKEDYDAWLAQQPTYADIRARKPGDAEAGRVAYALCGTCHGPGGNGNAQLHAPKLAGQSAWYMKRQLALFKSGARGFQSDDTYGRQMASMAATLVDDAAIENVVAYIDTLPDVAAPASVTGNPAKGKKIYTTCWVCHGLNGQGVQATSAPRTAGMSDWYLADQLKKFKLGLRGTHRKDPYGSQMRRMAQMLDDEAINDVVAYINTLDVKPNTIASSISGGK